MKQEPQQDEEEDLLEEEELDEEEEEEDVEPERRWEMERESVAMANLSAELQVRQTYPVASICLFFLPRLPYG